MIRELSETAIKAQAQVFVSYARQDSEQVLAIARLLEKEGATVWRDGDRILGGQYYGEEIVHAIAHSRVVMLMCSSNSFRSDNVHREILLTWEYYHRNYIPVWLGPATEIPERFRYCLVGCQWIDAHSQPPEQWLPQLFKAFKALGIETRNPAGEIPKPVDPACEVQRRALRFKPGDRPILGADWELERLLGKGGFGEVWKAHNPHLPNLPPVALKFCLELNARSRQLLHHEADMVLRAQRQIRSDGIVPLLHAYLNNDPPCLEFPYVEGGTLVRLLDECRESSGSFTPAQVQRIILRIAQIVGLAHRATPNLIHRDLKPSNVLVERRAGKQLVLRVTDFGIGAVAAQPMLDRSRSTSSLQGDMSSALTGAYSPLYASPQQMQGEKPDPRDDVYALGVMWYQLLKGDLSSPAPTGRRWIDVLKGRGMTDPAIDLMSSCFESDPDDRPADAGVLAEQLKGLTATVAKVVSDSTAELPRVEAVRPAAVEPPGPLPPTSAPQASNQPVEPPLSRPIPELKPAPTAHAQSAVQPKTKTRPAARDEPVVKDASDRLDPHTASRSSDSPSRKADAPSSPAQPGPVDPKPISIDRSELWPGPEAKPARPASTTRRAETTQSPPLRGAPSAGHTGRRRGITVAVLTLGSLGILGLSLFLMNGEKSRVEIAPSRAPSAAPGVEEASSFSPESILPKDTLLCLRLNNAGTFLNAVRGSRYARMWNDPAMSRFREDPKVKGLIGTLNEHLELCRGPIAIAVLKPDDLKLPLTPVLLADAGHYASHMNAALARFTTQRERTGSKVVIEKFKEATISVIRRPSQKTGDKAAAKAGAKVDMPDSPIVWTCQGTTVFASTDVDVVKDLVNHAGGRDDSLARNEAFVQAKQKLGSDGQVFWYVDLPKALDLVMKSMFSDKPEPERAAQSKAMLQMTGFDGLKYLAGNLVLNTPTFDSVMPFPRCPRLEGW